MEGRRLRDRRGEDRAGLETAHSLAQVGAFVAAVSDEPLGAFVLSVPFAVAASARAWLCALAAGTPGLDERLHCISPGLEVPLPSGAC